MREAAISAAMPDSQAAALIYESASGHVTVTSQHSALPLDQGTIIIIVVIIIIILITFARTSSDVAPASFTDGSNVIIIICCFVARIPVASARARDHLTRAVPRHSDGLLVAHGRAVPLAADQSAPANNITTDARRTRDPSSRTDRKKYAMPSTSKV